MQGSLDEVLSGFRGSNIACFVCLHVLRYGNVPRHLTKQERPEAGFRERIHVHFFAQNNRVDYVVAPLPIRMGENRVLHDEFVSL